MRERRRRRDRLRWSGGGVGLGLALVTVWGVGLTADLSGVGEAVRAWSADSQAVVGLLAEQLGQVPEETALAGDGRPGPDDGGAVRPAVRRAGGGGGAPAGADSGGGPSPAEEPPEVER